MLTRRSVLRSAAIAALVPLLSSCGNAGEILRVVLLANSLPPQLLRSFRSNLGKEATLQLTAESQLQDLFKLLQVWEEESPSPESASRWFSRLRLPFSGKKTPATADLISLGHYWLSEAIEKQLIAPLEVEGLAGWKNLPESMKELVQREGRFWGAPYRWGTTAIAYNRKRFEALGWTPTDWDDLWKPQLRDRISMIDEPREVIGLVLKTLGHSYNEPEPASMPQLKTALDEVHQHIRLYSSQAYLEPLIIEDVWVAVGWSTDLVSVAKRYPDIETIVPRSGTALWADLWVQPAVSRSNSGTRSLIQRWIEFCWQEQAARQISRFTAATSPILLSLERESLSSIISHHPLALPDADIIDRSEFIVPLPSKSQQQYETLWKDMRGVSR
ncbi:MAG: extracellular solute-binding protein [Cyanobacteriota bacterium]|nr:extracellular solute-binding protein [Cyanobacteriota bacterium]